MKNLIIDVFFMALVTYIPRVIPMTYLNNKKLSPFFKRFLHFIPFAALGALIFPGVIYSTSDIPSAVMGGIVAVGLAFFRLNIIVVVFGSILAVSIGKLLFI